MGESTPAVKDPGSLPLSHGQRSLWFINKLAPESAGAYTLVFTACLESVADFSRLEEAMRTVARRHRVLGAVFAEVHGEPVQRFTAREFALATTDARTWSAAQLRSAVEREMDRPFDLGRGPLARGHLFAVAPPAVESGDYLWVLTAHHIVMDLWSIAVLLDELRLVYAALGAGEEPELKPPPSYLDFVRWQEEMLAGPEGERLWSFWTRRLGGEPTPTELPTDRPRPALQSYRGASARVRIDAAAAGPLTTLARAAGATQFHLLLAAFYVLVGRYCAKTDLLLGTATAGRTRAPFLRLVGYCVNPVVLRADLGGDPRFADLLATTREIVREALSHQALPFPLLVERLQPIRDPRRSPLFQIMFLFQKPVRIPEAGAFFLGHPEARIEIAGMTLSPYPVAQPGAQFDLTVTLAPLAEGFCGTLQYNRDLFDATTMQRLGRHFEHLLSHLAATPARRLSEVPWWSPAEAHQLRVEWNDAGWHPEPMADREGRSVHALVMAQAAATPAAIAVEAAAAALSYAELTARARRLARFLAGRGVGPESRVGICVERHPELVVGVLGILAAGAAYVPLDPTYPPERLAFMVADADLGILLTEEALADRLPAGDAEIVCLPLPPAAAGPEPGPAVAVRGENLAWVLYTSGSTGRPKAVAITHHSAVALLRWAATAFLPDEVRGVLAATSMAWDLAVFELFAPLTRGGKVILAANPLELPELPAAAAVTLVNTVPSAMAEILRGGPLPPSVRAVNLAGEPLTRELARQVHDRSSSAAVRNLYGPSEDTTYSTWARIGRDGDEGPAIGRPVADSRAHLLDRHLQPVPLGVPGELYLGGAGLARGYLGRPALTAEHFCPDPFPPPPGSPGGRRLYRTGDLARLRPDGNLEFLGRSDQQVKIRGFRVELGEIEAVLGAHPEVTEAAVVVQGQATLVAYAVAPETVTDQDLRTWASGKLPPFMVPSAFVNVGALPRTPSGKLNRHALPAPDRRQRPEARVAPRTRLERTVAAIWRRVLGVDEIGVDDNFFDLGGHSLLLARVRSELRAVLGREVAMVDLLRHPTISALGRHLHRPGVARRRDEVPRGRGSEIAIIGMSGRFPGAPDLDAFWHNLRSGTESVSFFSPSELATAGVAAELREDPRYVPARGILQGVDLFDAAFFGFTPQQATITDPQHRLFLECAWEALEDAGYDPGRFPGPIGVFAGARLSAYGIGQLRGRGARPVDDYGILVAAAGDFLPTQVSYRLNLKGPSINVQTACSTSLVAVHLAVGSLLAGECDLALAGGVAIALPQETGYLYQEGGIASPDGHCRAFDAAAGGTVGGNGLGIVVLKRRAEALADGDRVQAVIRGSAVNNDGAAKVGYTAPGVDGQAAVVRDALAAAGVDPRTVTYVEAHGTGTRLGDPIEIAALAQAFREAGLRAGGGRFCALGSVKTNLGHLDPAAGIAGLIKTVLALKHREIPPSLHFREPNPEIDFGPFFVNSDLRPWPAEDGPRRAGVSSFGIGGTNAHVVLEEGPASKPSPEGRRAQLLVLSARTAPALEAISSRLAAHLRSLNASGAEVPLADVAFTLQLGRARFEHRRILVAGDAEDAAAALGSRDPRRALSRREKATRRPVAFMFPGQGTQYVNMGRELYDNEPAFRRQIDRGAEILRPTLGRDLRQVLYPPAGEEAEAAAALARTELTQPALFVVEHALAQLWIAWGVRPEALIGHSLGEYVAACVAGVLDFEPALALVALRARLIRELPEGAMLSVARPAAEIAGRLGTWDEVAVAATNAPVQTVVAGPVAALDELAAALAADGVPCRRLPVARAFHSPLMAPVAEPFAAALARVALRPPAIPYLSNLTGDWITAAEATDPDYWVRHLLAPVRFADGAGRLLADPETVFLEVGPGRQLGALIRRQGGTGPPVVGSMAPSRPAVEHLLSGLGKLWLTGVEVDWPAFHAGRRRRRVSLPTYPFERQRYWLDPDLREGGTEAPPRPELPARDPDPSRWIFVPGWRRTQPPPPLVALDSRPWLVFRDAAGLGSELAAHLARAGGRVVAVGPGEDFEAVLGDLDRRGAGPQRIVYLWPAGGGAPEGEAVGHVGADFCALLRLIKALVADPSPPGPLSPRTRLPVTERSSPGGEGELEGATLWRPVQAAPARSGPGDKTSSDLPSVSSPSPPGDDLPVTGSRVRGERGPGGEGSAGPPGVRGRGRSEGIELVVVTAGACDVTGGETLDPLQATFVGPVRVLPQEVPGLRCRAIDLDLSPELNVEALAGLLARELAAGAEDPIVALRGGHRWVPSYEPARRDRPGSKRLRPGGVYLITGGLGGLGLELADYLARTVQSKLVLVDRSPFPEPAEWEGWLANHDEEDPVSGKIRRLAALGKGGAEVMVTAADVADLQATTAAVRRARGRFGRIHGVIHAAGIAGGALLRDQTPARMDAVWAPKIGGARVLEAIFADPTPPLDPPSIPPYDKGGRPHPSQPPLDFLVLFSSLATVVGGVGQADFVAANAFLDAFARTCGLPAATFTVAIAWDAWQEVGMAEAARAERWRVPLEHAIRPAEGVGVFARILAGDLPQVIVSTRDLSAVRARLRADLDGAAPTGSRHPRPELDTAFVAPADAVESAIAEIWAELLGFDRVGMHDDFFELGGNSLLATQILSRMGRKLGLAISPEQLYDAASVADLAAIVRAGEAPSAELPFDEIEELEEGRL